MQHIGEGQFDLPAQWHDQSVNIFTAQGPGARGLSITINRDRLPFGMSLADYVKQQGDKLAKQLNGFQLIAQHALALNGHPAHELEFIWKTEDAGPVHQLLVSLAEREDGPKVLNMAGTLNGRMTDKQLAEVRRVLHSFEFNPADDGAGTPGDAASPAP